MINYVRHRMEQAEASVAAFVANGAAQGREAYPAAGCSTGGPTC